MLVEYLQLIIQIITYIITSIIGLFGGGHAFVFRMNSSSFLGNDTDWVDLIDGVRPVINLSADVTITGSGTVSDPYEVQ